MAEESLFRGVVEVFTDIGVYDIVLPLLLVFTIVFAILEKTKILGIEKIDGNEYTKKNLNSIVAFIVAFLVIASTQLVAVINQVMANIVLLLILSVSFLLLIGVFFKDQEFDFAGGFPAWLKFFMVVLFIGIVVIFLDALDWLQFVLAIFVLWPAQWTVTVVFLVVILGFMWYIVRDPPAKKAQKTEKKD